MTKKDYIKYIYPLYLKMRVSGGTGITLSNIKNAKETL